MNDSDKNLNLSDSMFNFDFMKVGPTGATGANKKPSDPVSSDGSDSVDEKRKREGSVYEFEKITSKADSSSQERQSLDSENVKNNGVDAEQVIFDPEMESRATDYFSLAVMRELSIVPAQFDSDSNTLTVICRSQSDEELPLKLEALLNCQCPVKIALQSAAPEIIDTLIARIENNGRFLKSIETDMSVAQALLPLSNDADALGLEFKERNDKEPHKRNSATESVAEQIPSSKRTLESATPLQSVLFVTPTATLSPHLMFAIRAEKIEPVIVADCDSALKEISKCNISQALIHNSLKDFSGALVTKLQKQREPIPVRYYSSETGLLTGDVYDARMIELFETNLRFAAYLSESPEEALDGHNAAVAELCSGISDSYSFSTALRLALLSAAHWHDIAARDLRDSSNYSHADIIALSASRLEALDCPVEVTRLLRIMSQPNQKSGDTESEITLAGCALAIADYYCHNWPPPASLKSEQLSEVRSDLQEFSASLAIPDMANTLLEIIEGYIESEAPQRETLAVHILDITNNQAQKVTDNLKSALKTAGFSSAVSCSSAECAQMTLNTEPQALIILHAGSLQEITDTLFALALNGITFDKTPTILLVSEDKLESVIWSIKHGIEDIFSLSVGPEILVTKITRAQKRLRELSQIRLSVLQDMGTHGSLEDMNLVKLLEALRDSSRPLLLSVTAQGKELIVFVDNNRVLYATCAELSGIEAISQSIDWSRGIWSMDPVEESELPHPNLGLTIDSVMLEACVQRDLSTRMSTNA